VPYSPRTPHIHFKIRRGGHELITTQLYIQGHPGNEKDPIWRQLKTKQDRDAVTVGFKAMPGAKAGEWAAHFDLVLGVTPEA
jgi:protocatechuate 3,4-dioxygenase beta subunit